MAKTESILEIPERPNQFDLYSRKEALSVGTIAGLMFSGPFGMIITSPVLTLLDDNILERISFVGFSYISFSAAGFISGYRSLRRLGK